MKHFQQKNHDGDDSSTTTLDEDQRSVALLVPAAAVDFKSSSLVRRRSSSSSSRSVAPQLERFQEQKPHRNEKQRDESNASNESQKYENDTLPLKKRRRVIVPDMAVSPATQTLNELNGMDLLEDNLYTQVSQVSYSQALLEGNFCRDEVEMKSHENVHSPVMTETKGEIAAVYDTGYKVILGTFSKEEANKRKSMAKEVIKQFRATYGYTKLKDKEWLHTQLEERGIREPSRFNVMTKPLVESQHAKDPIQTTRTNVLSITDVARTNQEDNENHTTNDLDCNHRPNLHHGVENSPSLPITRQEPTNHMDVNAQSDTNSEDMELENIPSYEGEPKVIKRLYYRGVQIYLSSCYQKCAEQRHRRAKQWIQRWTTSEPPPTIEWVKMTLQNRGYREEARIKRPKESTQNSTYSVNENQRELRDTDLPTDERHMDPDNNSKYVSNAECSHDSTMVDHNVIPTTHTDQTSNYTVREVKFHHHGPMGFTIRTISMESVEICLVTSVKEDSHAQRSGLRVNDVIVNLSADIDGISFRAMTVPTIATWNSLEEVKFASVKDIVQWSNSSSRPIAFYILRRDYVSRSATGKHKNGSETIDIASLNISETEINRAIRGKKVFPRIPCCKRCSGDETRHHHYLCSKHKYFQTSGAKDILIILLAGIRDKCQACAYEIMTGKKSTSMQHIKKCDRQPNKSGKKMNSKAGKKTSSSKGGKLQGDPSGPTESLQNQHLPKQMKRAVTPKSGSTIDTHGGSLATNGLKQTTLDGSRSRKVTPARRIDPLVKSKNDEIRGNDPLILGDVSTEDQWISCANPWGPMGFCDGDIIYDCPADYQYRNQIYGHNPKRFIDEPFADGSPYRQTHSIKETVELKRDPMALLDWGFEFSYHDFGGACIITKVDPISPAADARIIGDPDQVSSVRDGDIILLVNGMRVGSKTELDIAVELEVSRSWMTLTIAKCTNDYTSGNKGLNWQNIDDAIVFDSLPVAEAASDDVTIADQDLLLGGDQSVTASRKSKERTNHGHFDDDHCTSQIPAMLETSSVQNGSHEKSSQKLTRAEAKNVEVDSEKNDSNVAEKTDTVESTPDETDLDMEENYESDENPWLPCICGSDHKSQYETLFWIQCDECEAWYNCAPSCIGFSRKEVNDIKTWECPDCKPNPIVISSNKSNNKEPNVLNDILETVTPQKRNTSDCDGHPFAIGTIVRVEDRSWMPGRYLGGGVAKILMYKKEDDDYLYDVQYIHGGKENSVEAEYVSIDHTVDTPRTSRRSSSSVVD